jgi:hypothetical protein
LMLRLVGYKLYKQFREMEIMRSPMTSGNGKIKLVVNVCSFPCSKRFIANMYLTNVASTVKPDFEGFGRVSMKATHFLVEKGSLGHFAVS